MPTTDVACVRVHVGGSVRTKNVTCCEVTFLFNGLCLLHPDIACISHFTPFCADETLLLLHRLSEEAEYEIQALRQSDEIDNEVHAMR